VRGRLVAVLLGGVALSLGLAGASLGWAQQAGDNEIPIQPAQPPKAPAAKTPATPKAAPEAPPAPGAPTASSDEDTASVDESNPEVDSAAPPSHPAPAKPVEPMKRPRYAAAVMQALDKVTAETVRFEAPINKPIRYKSLIIIVRACETTAPDESISDAAAHVEIDTQPQGVDGKPPPPARQVFRGWMFDSSPGLHLLEHPTYDAWLIACKTAAPSA